MSLKCSIMCSSASICCYRSSLTVWFYLLEPLQLALIQLQCQQPVTCPRTFPGLQHKAQEGTWAGGGCSMLLEQLLRIKKQSSFHGGHNGVGDGMWIPLGRWYFIYAGFQSLRLRLSDQCDFRPTQ